MQYHVRILEAQFLDQEIKEVVWGCECSNSLGPDGYNFYFIRKCWHFLKANFIWFVKDFHSNAVLEKAITFYFLTLIPKNDNPQNIDDFCHNCLVGCLYKCLSKLLVIRLQKVLHDFCLNVRLLLCRGDNFSTMF